MSTSDEYILLDVRSAAEYKETRIAGAKLIPVDELGRRAPVELSDKHIPIFIYCRSGARAARAADFLAGIGYTSVYSFGGIMNWQFGTVRE